MKSTSPPMPPTASLTVAAAAVALLASLVTTPAWAQTGSSAAPLASRPQVFSGKVLRVTDGDTLVVENQGRAVTVRLRGIDAPQLSQPYGAEARKQLYGAVFGKTVRVEGSRRDRATGFLLADVFVLSEDTPQKAGPLVPPRTHDPTGTRPDLPKGLPGPRGDLPRRTLARDLNVGQEMVRAGLAWADVRSVPRDKALADLQAEARGAKRGLWATARPTPPWQFRPTSR